ncbi:10492_t:CDS:10 [Diversispora eburnea]|uniref:10492_t:CDS:1 n=1 Tax=Diversispora eburnea TaxID=1213867 RepID=A0A9N9GD09_9GLOM|nr:10492_t:CDS:10 [Diversispora eburnea]
MTRYRPLIMLAVGITFIYWIISIHSPPHPYPKNIAFVQSKIFMEPKPDGVFIYIKDDWIYLTAVWKEYEVIGDVRGVVKQYKRPLHLLLSSDNNFDPNNEGPITHISSYYHKNISNPTSDLEYNENNALAILYQRLENERNQYVLRLYNLENLEDDFDDFNMILPGTTKIMSFHVANSLILYSRNHDDSKFRTIQIPINIFEISKKKNEPIILKSSEPGPLQNVIRVMQAEITANDELWNFKVIVHNSSLSEDSDRSQINNWGTKSLIAYKSPTSKKEEYDFVQGMTMNSPLSIPKLIVVTARNVTTICIALNNALFTFDYRNTTSSEQKSKSKEAYTVGVEHLPLIEEWPFQVIGMEINPNGNLLLLVTQENYILIYKRANANGESWELKMVITAPYLDFISQSDLYELDVIAVRPINISKLNLDNNNGIKNTGNILLTLFDNGSVATFHLDKAEQEMKLWFIIRRQWQMYIGMLCVVLAFVWNELN